MPPAFTHSDPGTDPEVWRTVRDRAHTVHFADLGDVERVVVLAPHPDDESLGAGGLLSGWSSLGRPAMVVAVSDGGAGVDPERAPGTAALRRHEQHQAVEQLRTRGRIDVTHLELPDGALGDHVAALTARLEQLVVTGDLLVAPWPGDGHPDHHAVGTAARSVAQLVGAELFEYPIWLWHWGGPADLDNVELVRVPLGPAVRAAKARALQAHRSQLEGDDPVLGPHVLAHFDGDAEVFITATAARRTQPLSRSTAEFFEAMYAAAPDADPWGFAASQAEQRRYDQVLAMVPRREYRRCIEPGCGTGELTRRLRDRCAHVLGVDVSATAVARAERTLADQAGPTDGTVELRVGAVPDVFGPDDVGFDLVVLSELAYYFEPDGLANLVDELRRRASDDAVTVAAHWNGISEDHRLGVDEAHDVIADVLGTPSRTAEFETFRVDVWLPTT